KGCSLARSTQHIDCATVSVSDALHNRKSQAAAFEFSCEERVENPAFLLFCHAATRIRHLQAHVIAFIQLHWTGWSQLLAPSYARGANCDETALFSNGF